MYRLLDILFLLFHTGLSLFVLTGWMFRALRPYHLAVTTLTFLSWFGLGLVYGFGYCPSTDWHWQVKRRLGETDLPHSFVKYALDRMTGSEYDAQIVDLSVFVAALLALVLTLWLNWRDRRTRAGTGRHPRT